MVELGEAAADIRKWGGGLFGDQRYGHVFVCHNGARSYCNDRGCRGALWA